MEVKSSVDKLSESQIEMIDFLKQHFLVCVSESGKWINPVKEKLIKNISKNIKNIDEVIIRCHESYVKVLENMSLRIEEIELIRNYLDRNRMELKLDFSKILQNVEYLKKHVTSIDFILSEGQASLNEMTEPVKHLLELENSLQVIDLMTKSIFDKNTNDLLKEKIKILKENSKKENVGFIASSKFSERKVNDRRRLRPCCICGKHCERGTSVFYGSKPNRKQVHKGECLILLKLKLEKEN